MIQTVDGIKRNFSKKEIEQADRARCLYVTVGCPSQKIFEEMIKRGKLFNANITSWPECYSDIWKRFRRYKRQDNSKKI
jgi:hypothetical protein